MFKHVLALSGATLLAGCASTPELGTRLVIGTPAVAPAANSPLKHSLQVNDVSDGSVRTSFWSNSRLSSAAVMSLSQALPITLSAQGMLAGAGGRRNLDAVVLEIKAPPSLGPTITSTVRYVVTDVATRSVIFDQTIVADYTASFSDQPFSGGSREGLAFDGSIRNNISKFLDQLIAMPGGAGSEAELGAATGIRNPVR